MNLGLLIRPPSDLTVSAIVPNFNHGHLVEHAIRALQGQSLGPLEIIVVDDCSTDNSRTILHDLARQDPRIRIALHEENRGTVAALNTGIALATGSLVYLGAADDIAHTELIRTLSELATRYPGCGLYSGAVTRIEVETGARGIRPWLFPSPDARVFTPSQTRLLLGKMDNFLMTGAALLDRTKLIEAGGLLPSLGSFADGFLVRQLALRHGFAFTPDILAEWRISRLGYSLTTASNPLAIRTLTKQARAAIAADPTFPPDYADMFARRLLFSVLRLALRNPRANHATVAALYPGPLPLRGFWASLAQIPAVGRWLVLAVAAFVLRPIAFETLIGSVLSKWFEVFRSKNISLT